MFSLTKKSNRDQPFRLVSFSPMISTGYRSIKGKCNFLWCMYLALLYLHPLLSHDGCVLGLKSFKAGLKPGVLPKLLAPYGQSLRGRIEACIRGTALASAQFG